MVPAAHFVIPFARLEQTLGCRVERLRFKAQGVWFNVCGLNVYGLVFECLVFRVSGLVIRVLGLGFI